MQFFWQTSGIPLLWWNKYHKTSVITNQLNWFDLKTNLKIASELIMCLSLNFLCKWSLPESTKNWGRGCNDFCEALAYLRFGEKHCNTLVITTKLNWLDIKRKLKFDLYLIMHLPLTFLYRFNSPKSSLWQIYGVPWW